MSTLASKQMAYGGSRQPSCPCPARPSARPRSRSTRCVAPASSGSRRRWPCGSPLHALGPRGCSSRPSAWWSRASDAAPAVCWVPAVAACTPPWQHRHAGQQHPPRA
eukprot:810993-Alexandrium_andersonii.AAC.1